MYKAITLLLATMIGIGSAEARTLERPTRIEIDTHIDLPFSATQVWAVLANTKSYPDWNPYHVRVDGELKKGSRLEIEIHKPNDHHLVIHPRVISVVPELSLVWGGGVPGIFHGVHRFDLEPVSNNCTRLYHTEVFAGLAVNFAELDAIEPGYKGMNQALLAYLKRSAGKPIGRC